jgi:molybdopterin synthase catalytic subunit
MTYMVSQPLDAAALLAAVAGPGRGGTTIFVGTVRESPEDGPVETIEYSAYPEMAEAEGDRIVAAALARYPAARVTFRHRLGSVPLGEASVAVAAAAPHRAEAFDACRFVIEEIKRRLPVWKKEMYRNGTAAWKGNDGSRDRAARA